MYGFLRPLYGLCKCPYTTEVVYGNYMYGFLRPLYGLCKFPYTTEVVYESFSTYSTNNTVKVNVHVHRLYNHIFCLCLYILSM